MIQKRLERTMHTKGWSNKSMQRTSLRAAADAERYMLSVIHMKNIRISVIYICASLLIACTNQEIYDAVQENRQQECQKLPPSAYEECIKQHSEPYDGYERRRQEALKKNNG